MQDKTAAIRVCYSGNDLVKRKTNLLNKRIVNTNIDDVHPLANMALTAGFIDSR